MLQGQARVQCILHILLDSEQFHLAKKYGKSIAANH